MKKSVVLIISIIAIALIIICIIFIKNKELDLNSEEVTNLYSYLGEVDIYHCGGLNQYTGKKVSYNDISINNKLCLAYYEINDKNIKNEESDVSQISDNTSICEIGNEIKLVAEDNENICKYQKISQEELNKSYQNIYGKDISNEDIKSFYISAFKACYLEEGEYYCGNAESFTYSLVPESTIYRLLNTAIKKINGEIIITDYYLRISDNKCYFSNSINDEINECSQELAKNPEAKINSDFVQKYGTLYEHTFKKNSIFGGNYWYSSNIKN